jgi:hypothetical protein
MRMGRFDASLRHARMHRRRSSETPRTKDGDPALRRIGEQGAVDEPMTIGEAEASTRPVPIAESAAPRFQNRTQRTRTCRPNRRIGCNRVIRQRF